MLNGQKPAVYFLCTPFVLVSEQENKKLLPSFWQNTLFPQLNRGESNHRKENKKIVIKMDQKNSQYSKKNPQKAPVQHFVYGKRRSMPIHTHIFATIIAEKREVESANTSPYTAGAGTAQKERNKWLVLTQAHTSDLDAHTASPGCTHNLAGVAEGGEFTLLAHSFVKTWLF